ncbi:hypothetical protein [Bacillus cereus]|uniref:hypothetical protein n=1 Tax=Bacillus cereus TaxID=1396 RepID=UPI000BF3163F|nr:hypothetical protein [Bacillus cereus]PFA64053.1 hypothetical protein CN403_29815 [Bacillus cereus]
MLKYKNCINYSGLAVLDLFLVFFPQNSFANENNNNHVNRIEDFKDNKEEAYKWASKQYAQWKAELAPGG